MHLFLLEAHSRHAALKSKSSKQGPSIEINSSCTVILLLRQGFSEVSLFYSVQKSPHSQQWKQALAGQWLQGYKCLETLRKGSLFFTIVAITSCSVWQRICTLKWHSRWNLTGTIFAKWSINGPIQYWLSSSRLLSKQVLNMQITSLRLCFLHMHLLSHIWSISRQSQITDL